MNITGNRTYSSATVGLKQPGKITDQHLKLVFIYPMLFCDKTGKYKQLLRQFLSISFLKEIFISNSLNVISMASQIRPITDVDGNEVKTDSLLANALLALNRGSSDFTRNVPQTQYQYDRSNASELQYRIKEKTAIIRNLLNVDPRLNPLMPYVEMVTMENLIDVPVIVGTKTYDIDTFMLSSIIIAAIGFKKTLSKKEDIDFIIDKLKTTRPDLWFSLINNLIKVDSINYLDVVNDFLKKNGLTKGIYNLVSSAINKVTGRFPTKTAFTQPSEEVELKRTQRIPEHQFDILKFVKDDLDQVKLFYKFMLDPNMIKSQIGLKQAPGQMVTSVERISPNMDRIFMAMQQNFIKLMSESGEMILRSCYNIIFPIDATTSIHDGDMKSFIKLKDEIIDTNLNEGILKIINDDIVQNISTALKQNAPGQAADKMKIIKSMCGEIGSQIQSTFSNNISKMSNYYQISNPNYDQDKFLKFMENFDELSSKCSSQTKQFEMQYMKLAGNSALESLKRIRGLIGDHVNQFFQHISTYINRGFNSKLAVVAQIPNDHIIQKVIPEMINMCHLTFYFLFMACLQDAICKLVDVLDVEIETAINDALDLPNYTLVLPVEVISAIYSAVLAKTWQQIVSNDAELKGAPAITDNYIKGVIKFIALKLQVPNIIVIDSKKSKIYYKFQFLSGINNTSIQTMETFIQAHINKEISA